MIASNLNYPIFSAYSKVLVLDADKDLDNIGTEYKRSEESIIDPILKQQQQPFAITVSPSKRKFLSN